MEEDVLDRVVYENVDLGITIRKIEEIPSAIETLITEKSRKSSLDDLLNLPSVCSKKLCK